jgi:tRNA pseudouridine38-40 synthase
MNTYKLTIEYDGTGFSGWQRQDDRPTIQGELEAVLSRILNQDIRIHGSGRTDAGVHAMGQVAHFRAETRLAPGQILKGVNSLMRHSIVLRDCVRAADDFHAQYQARSKEYRYYILNRPTPNAVGRNYCWHVNRPLDTDVMTRCSRYLEGCHDFKAFENTGSPRSSTVREVFSAGWIHKEDEMLVFSICASGFLKNMVRNIVGTLKDAGSGKLDTKTFGRILAGRDRSLAGATAPAKGLFLYRVEY